MKSFDERRDEVFARAERMKNRRRARLRAAVIVGLLFSLLVVGTVGAVAAYRSAGATGEIPETDTPGGFAGELPEELKTGLLYAGSEGGKALGFYGNGGAGRQLRKTVGILFSLDRLPVIYGEDEKAYDLLANRIAACLSAGPALEGTGAPLDLKQETRDAAYIYLFDGEKVQRYVLWDGKLQEWRDGGKTAALSNDDLAFFAAIFRGQLPD